MTSHERVPWLSRFGICHDDNRRRPNGARPPDCTGNKNCVAAGRPYPGTLHPKPPQPIPVSMAAFPG